METSNALTNFLNQIFITENSEVYSIELKTFKSSQFKKETRRKKNGAVFSTCDIVANSIISNKVQSEYKMNDNSKETAVIQKLTYYKLTREESHQLIDFYRKNNDFMKKLKDPCLIHKNELKPKLPHSIFSVPKSRFKGIYALLKTIILGKGTFNKVCIAVNLENGMIKAFRSGMKSINDVEEEINITLLDSQEYFAAGFPMHYIGNLSHNGRGERKKVGIQKYYNVQKVGYIIDYAECGSLIKIYNSLKKIEKCKIASKIAGGLALLHSFKIVHKDLKIHNIFITADNQPKIGDFGFSTEVEKEINGLGTIGHLPPEFFIIYQNKIKQNAKPCQDIWALGCLYAWLFSFHNHWHKYTKKLEGKGKNGWPIVNTDRTEFDMTKKLCFPKYTNPTKSDYIIFQCLEFSPKLRPTAAQVVEMWEKLFFLKGSSVV